MTKHRKKPAPPKPSEATRSEAELTQLAIDFVTDKVFFCRPDNHNAATRAFGLVLSLMDEQTVKAVAETNPQFLYEYYDKAMPRSINGSPMFASMSIVKASEWEVFARVYNEKQRALYGDGGKEDDE